MMLARSGSGSDSGSRSTMTRSRSSVEEAICRPSKSLRCVKYCTELLPRRLMCSGCVLYLDASPALKAKGPRAITHRGVRFQCKQSFKEEDGSFYYGRSRFEVIQEYLRNEVGISTGRISSVALPFFSPPAKEESDNEGDEEETVSPLSDPSSTLEPDGRKRKKEKEEVQLETTTVNSQGHSFIIDGVPRSHVVVHKSKMQRLQNLEQQVKELQSRFSSYRFDPSSSSHFMQTLIAVAVCSCPALPLSQSATILPLFCAACFVDAGLMDKANANKFSKSFPSESKL
jgi:hypothetical protein